MGIIREPKKKTSIEKKNRIIQKGFELICEKGFHNVSCVDIAKHAGVSTGIIYQYFKDKEDIFIQGVKVYADSIMFPMLDVLRSVQVNLENAPEVMHLVIQKLLDNHRLAEEMHEEIMGMMHSNRAIRDLMTDYEYRSTNYIVDILLENGFPQDGLKEKIHIAYKLLDEFCHEVVYHQHPDLDYQRMEQDIIRIICLLLF